MRAGTANRNKSIIHITSVCDKLICCCNIIIFLSKTQWPRCLTYKHLNLFELSYPPFVLLLYSFIFESQSRRSWFSEKIITQRSLKNPEGCFSTLTAVSEGWILKDSKLTIPIKNILSAFFIKNSCLPPQRKLWAGQLNCKLKFTAKLCKVEGRCRFRRYWLLALWAQCRYLSLIKQTDSCWRQ